MATLKLTQHITLDDELLVGSLSTPNSLTVSGTLFEGRADIAAAGFDTLWETGWGGITTGDVIIITTDNPIWVELRNDHTSAAEYALVEVTADNPLVLTSDNLGTSAATQADGVAFADNTEYAQIDQINVQNDGSSTARVRVLVID